MRLEVNPEPTTLLDTMILAGQEENDLLSNKELIGNVLTVLLAGEDTTANTLAWTLFYLSVNPDIFNELRAEIDTLGKHFLELEPVEITKLKFLDGVINESMRLKPVAPFFFMENNVLLNLNGVNVPKGTNLIFIMMANYLDKAYFESPNQFIPSRWSDSSESNKSNVFFPFGFGPRTCIGKGLALLEMKLAIIAIVKNYNLSLHGPESGVGEAFYFTLRPTNLFLKIRKR